MSNFKDELVIYKLTLAGLEVVQTHARTLEEACRAEIRIAEIKQKIKEIEEKRK